MEKSFGAVMFELFLKWITLDTDKSASVRSVASHWLAEDVHLTHQPVVRHVKYSEKYLQLCKYPKGHSQICILDILDDR